MAFQTYVDANSSVRGWAHLEWRITYSPTSRELLKRRVGRTGATSAGVDTAATECIEDSVGELKGLR